MGRTKPGDGRALRPMRHVQFLWRTQLGIDHDGSRWVVEQDSADGEERIELYRDGVQVAKATSPARFELPGARIEARIASGRVRRARLVTSSGARRMTPERGTAEHGRARFAERFPVASAVVAAVSFTIVVGAAILELPQLVELVTNLEPVRDRLGWSFVSPIRLPADWNVGITIAGVVASIERGWRFKHIPFVDE
ncbi:hypothetical protein [Agrococcus sp. SGAir0287]|uniref:hypothetical protein n=1 Tax=Agrococcus sp. SGAir0287 TaxID=2070347 RepID=UPI0010F6ADF3|nr:hypothetical protein [Agrococcus sp. SGAir0287]